MNNAFHVNKNHLDGGKVGDAQYHSDAALPEELTSDNSVRGLYAQ